MNINNCAVMYTWSGVGEGLENGKVRVISGKGKRSVRERGCVCVQDPWVKGSPRGEVGR